MDYFSSLVQNIWNIITSNLQSIQVLSYFAIVGTFLTSLIAFRKTFNQNKKNEQIKTVIEINKQLLESEIKIEYAYKDIEFKTDTTSTEEVTKEFKKNNNNEIQSSIVTYFNLWEWFALLVNTKFISEEVLKNFFKERFIDEYRFILRKFFPYLKFPEIQKLYENWK